MQNAVASDRLPLKHVQVREYLRALATELAPGSATPSERELVQLFGVARMTVRQATDALVGEGVLERIPGRGTFVAKPRSQVGRLMGFTEDMRRRNLPFESTTLIARLDQAGPGVARALDITEGDAVIRWRRLRRADGLPICLEDTYLNEVLLPGFLQAGLPESLYSALSMRDLRPTWAEDAMSADLATFEEARLLEIPHRAAVLRRARRAAAGDKIVEVTRTVFRADRYVSRVQLGDQ